MRLYGSPCERCKKETDQAHACMGSGYTPALRYSISPTNINIETFYVSQGTSKKDGIFAY